MIKKNISIIILVLAMGSIGFANDGKKENRRVEILKALENTNENLLKGNQASIKKTATYFDYEDNSIYEIKTKPNYLTTIKLQPGEVIQDSIATGDTENFMIDTLVGGKDNRTFIYLMPTEEDLKTNVSIVTDRHSYNINVSSTADEYNPIIEWKYPLERKIKLEQYAEQQEKLGVDDFLKLNYQYKWDKNSVLSPIQVFDNGEKTFVVLKEELQELPAFYVKGDDEELYLVTPIVKDKNIIIQRVGKEITLKLGNKSLVIKSSKK